MLRIYIDEAGRGPLAGPIHVGLILPMKKFITMPYKDSKVLTEERRKVLFERMHELQSDGKCFFAIASSAHNEIDKRGMTKAINMAIKRGLKALLPAVGIT